MTSTPPQCCRLCGSANMASILDLGATPPCERILTQDQLDEPEPFYPLHLQICQHCLLAQLPALIPPEDIFTEYAYFSSYSPSWVSHAKRFVDAAIRDLRLDSRSFVIEVASNDGYLLQHFVSRGVPCLGVEPSVNVGAQADKMGIPTITKFLTPQTAADIRANYGTADLLVANNVYAHVPDIVGFTHGLRTLVSDDGWVSIEVQHLLSTVRETQFDTIYHKHFQYYTVYSARQALASGGLNLIDVELIPTHGGSLRLWARPAETRSQVSPHVNDVLAAERAAGLLSVRGYLRFARDAERVRRELKSFLVTAAEQGKRVVGYGAPGKGNTLLNYCQIGPDILEYTVDRDPYTHGHFTPGTRIPIHPVDRIAQDKPDYVLVLPWNLREELTEQLGYIGSWGGKLVFPMPRLKIVSISGSTAVEVN